MSIAYFLYLRDFYGLSLNIAASPADFESQGSLFRSMVQQRTQYVKLVNQTTNRLHQYLLVVFPEGELQYFDQLLKIIRFYPTPEDILKSQGLKKIDGITDEERHSILTLAKTTVGVPGTYYRWLIRDLCIQRLEAQSKIKYLSNLLLKEVNKHPYGEILLSFPGIGGVISATLIGIIKDINYWPDKRNLKKMLGVYGREYISGASPQKRRPGKGGNRIGKKVLFQACKACLRKNVAPNDFRDYYERQLKHNKVPFKAIASTCGKMAEIVYHCLKTGEKYQYLGKYQY